MGERFDLVVIGTGAGGSAPAYRCRKEGWQVAVVDELPYGGTCALRGCDPKKVLVGAADLVAWHRRMEGQGIAGDTAIDWPALMRFKRTFTDPVPGNRAKGFERVGVATYHGTARFVAPDRLEVNGKTLEARHFVVAVGAAPRPLGIPGGDHVITSTEFLELEHLPGRIVFVGAGYISFEFAHVARRAGAEAVIVGRGKALAQFEQDLVKRLVEHSRELGVEVHLGTEVTAVERKGDQYLIRANAGRDITVTADLVVHGAGRLPNTAGLGLDTAEVATEANGGLQVTEYLQSPTNARVYAAGDAAAVPGAMPLTPVAGYEGGIVASNLLQGNSRTPDYRGIPSVVFTVPPLAGVGLTEEEVRREGLDVQVETGDASGWYSNRRVAEPCAGFKSLVDEKTDRILGMHLLGHHAEEVINLFALAIRNGLTAKDLRHQLYAYPTVGSDVPYML